MNAPQKSILDMSDAEVMAMSSPPPATSTATTGDESDDTDDANGTPDATDTVTPPDPAAEDGADAAGTNTDDTGADAAADPDGAAAGGDGTGAGQGDAAGDAGDVAAVAKPDAPAPSDAKPADTPVPQPGVKPAGPSTDAEFAAVGKELFVPFKANGKDFQVESIDEARKLMQMGCNYTKKLQELQPVKRIITMLSNNQLLDEGKLAYLIDLEQKKPEAIQKLLADSQFDPLTADKEAAARYTPGPHQVSDLELQFTEALDEVAASPTGGELISEVQGQWDPASKQALFQNPALLRTINEHKAMGLYAVIHAEVERQRTLGQIPASTPYLQAYKAMGDMLHEQGRLQPQATQRAAPAAVVPAAPVETRVVAPPVQVAASDKAKAAASTKSSTPAAKGQVNYLDLSDDEFQKQVGARL